MPELPELQAHAERLTAAFAGSVLERFEPISFTALKTATPFPEAAVGAPLSVVGRRGKLLLLRFADAPTFVVHLMQGGRLRPDTARAARPRGGLARWRFVDEDALVLTEAGKEHRAGVWCVAGEPEDHPPLAGLGPDADTLDAAGLAARLTATTGRLHGVLRDQKVLAGLGRRLANEICHHAQLSPFANAARLDEAAVGRLTQAIASCISASLAFERDRAEMSNAAQRPGAVHHRAGQRCPVCDDVIRSVTYRSYEVDYCATCQTDGKVLADNTTSRFLK